MNLSFFLMHYPVRALGPGTRVGLWCQGCSIHCADCISPEGQPFLPERGVPVSELAKRIVGYGAEGLTVSGGEPFDQPEALMELLRILNAQGLSDILIYSGYQADDLLKRYPDLADLAAVLIDGPFEPGNVTTSTWKGSDNQRLHLWRMELGPRYRDWMRSSARKLQLAKDIDGRRFLIGIPKQEDTERLKAAGP